MHPQGIAPAWSAYFHDDRIEKTDTCWLWKRAGTTGGYGLGYFRLPGNSRGWNQTAHRVSWMLAYGEIPDGLWVLHRCNVRRCVRPDHLYLGTQIENMRQMSADGRQVFQQHPERAPRGPRNGAYTKPERRPRGERNGKYTKPEQTPRGDQHWTRVNPATLPRGERQHLAKLTEDDVRTIRATYKGHSRTHGAIALAARYGVHPSQIKRVIRGATWKHVV